jgi:hypothetical protein
VNRDAAEWLNARLHFPRWQHETIASLGTTRIGDWAKTSGAHINHGYETEVTEGGVLAVGRDFPAPSRQQLQAVPASEWTTHKNDYVWQGWAKRMLVQEGLSPDLPSPQP